MFCKNCGNEVQEGNFCTNCGTKAEAVNTTETIVQKVDAVESTPAVESAPVVNNNTNTNNATPAQDPGDKQGNIALILGIIALALGSLCSCLFACLGGIAPLGCGIAGVIIGLKAMNASKAAGFKNNKALVGLILSIVAIVIIAIFIIINAVAGALIAIDGSF